MRKYLLTRFLNTIIIFVGVVIAMYFVYVSLPGNYVDTLLDPSMSIQERKQMEHELHLDQPKIVQFRYWITGVMKGDFGRSFQYTFLRGDTVQMGIPIGMLIKGTFWHTFNMLLLSFICSLLLAIPIGTISATRPHSGIDNFWTIFALIGISMPPFVIGSILLKLLTFNMFVFKLEIFNKIPFDSYVMLLRGYILPFLVITYSNLALFMRYMRSSVLEVIRQDYINTARAKGLKEKVVLYKHALRNSLIPVITFFGTSFSGMLSGMILVEMVFRYPGLGTMLLDACHRRDYPLMMGITITMVIVTLISNFLIDIIYSFIDPRIRLSKQN